MSDQNVSSKMFYTKIYKQKQNKLFNAICRFQNAKNNIIVIGAKVMSSTQIFIQSPSVPHHRRINFFNSFYLHLIKFINIKIMINNKNKFINN